MSIVKEKNGSYTVRWRTKDINTGKTVNKKKRGFALKREAVDFEKTIDSKDKEVTTNAMTFREAWKEWEKFADSSDTVIRHHNEAFNIRFNAYLDLPVKDFTRPMLSTWRNQIADLPIGTRTKNTTITYVKAVFRYCSEMYNISNPAVILKPFKLNDEEVMKEMDVWSVAEFNQFIKCVDLIVYKLFFTTLFWTGMRRGECIALSVNDLHDGWLDVHSSQRDASDGRKPTKTKRRRQIQIDSQLNKQLHDLASNKKKSEYLFGDNGLAPTTIGKVFKKAIELSGVKEIRLHDLRHSHATWLINNGANIVAVSKRLGHSTIEQTLKTYTHLLESTDDAMMNIIEKGKKQ